MHIINHFYPKLGYQEYFLAKTHGYQHNVLVISSNRFGKSIFESNRSLLGHRSLKPGLYIEEGVKVLRLPALFDNPPFEIPWLIGLEQAVMDFSPDAIILHGVVSFSSIMVSKLKKKLPRVKIIVDDHMTYNATRGKQVIPLYNMFKRMFMPLLLDSVDCFVGVTYETKEFMQAVYGIPNKKITIIPLGVDTYRFRYDPNARRHMRKEYGIEDNHVLFIYAGKVIPSKGVHIFVDAGLKLCEKSNNVLFLIVGGKEPKYFNCIQRKILKAGKSDRFIFVDTVPNEQLY
ncbi:MAG: glycosyltransferase family 4 protein, partial [Candidatus Bathyarchaeia archaeon]